MIFAFLKRYLSQKQVATPVLVPPPPTGGTTPAQFVSCL